MLDPVSIGLAISTASKAFDMIQRGFAVGRELEQMHGDMGEVDVSHGRNRRYR
jgi:hypothetical protein